MLGLFPRAFFDALGGHLLRSELRLSYDCVLVTPGHTPTSSPV